MNIALMAHDQKKELIYAKIDRKKKILGTVFLRVLGYSTREEIIRCFYDVEDIDVKNDSASKDALGNTIHNYYYSKDDAKADNQSIINLITGVEGSISGLLSFDIVPIEAGTVVSWMMTSLVV